ncbi:MAG: glycosyltransferase [Anaerolineales bacterium]|jgi:1,2-diacylglycerol 3-alpha-glucosyltransferase
MMTEIHSAKQRLHVANFTNTYLPLINGIVRSVSSFRQALSDLGHNAFVFAQEAEGYEDQEPFIFRYPTINLPLPYDFPAILPLSAFIDRLFPSLKADVVHTHHPILLGQAGANKAERYGIPLVFTFHTQYREYTHYVPLPQEAVQTFIKDAVDVWMGEYMQKCQHVLVPSRGMYDILVDKYGLRERVTVLPTGIDLEPYQRAEGSAIRDRHGWQEKRVLISVGRLGAEKNWEMLIEAGALAMQEHPDLHIAILGDGPQRKELEDLARELGIAANVELVGKVPFEQVPNYLKAADLFGFASTTETQGLVTLEAMASGLPVVAVDATGTNDVVEHEREGLLTEKDSRALAQALKSVLEDERRMSGFKKAALEKARQFDILNQAKKLVEVYHQAIEDKRAGRFVVVENLGDLRGTEV